MNDLIERAKALRTKLVNLSPGVCLSPGCLWCQLRRLLDDAIPVLKAHETYVQAELKKSDDHIASQATTQRTHTLAMLIATIIPYVPPEPFSHESITEALTKAEEILAEVEKRK